MTETKYNSGPYALTNSIQAMPIGSVSISGSLAVAVSGGTSAVAVGMPMATMSANGAVLAYTGTAGNTYSTSISSVGFSSSNEPYAEGTSASVYRIGALVEAGVTPEEVQEDFPTLGTNQIKALAHYAQANKMHTQRYPSRTFSQALRESGLYKIMK